MVCLLTPQSNPFHAEACVQKLESAGVFDGVMTEKDISGVLRTPAHYVRFHHTKAKRILRFVRMVPEITALLQGGLTAEQERGRLVELVDGFGLKEGSHALRNIGRRDLAILDRHILRNLLKFGAIDAIPSSMSPKRYLEIEGRFRALSEALGERMDVLDLFFWAQAVGRVFK